MRKLTKVVIFFCKLTVFLARRRAACYALCVARRLCCSDVAVRPSVDVAGTPIGSRVCLSNSAIPNNNKTNSLRRKI